MSKFIIAANHNRPLTPYTVLCVATGAVSYHCRVIAERVCFKASKQELTKHGGGRTIVAHAETITTVTNPARLPGPIELEPGWVQLVYHIGEFRTANMRDMIPRDALFSKLILTEHRHIYADLTPLVP